MTITNYKNQYLRVNSDRLRYALAHVSDYAGFFHVTAKIGCNGIEYKGKTNFAFLQYEDNRWVIDTLVPVQLENTVYSLKVKNIHSLESYEVITAPIDLGYVADNCTDPSGQCLIDAFSAHFSPLFKSQIDAYFDSIGITSDVTVVFSGEFMQIGSMPDGFIMGSIGFNNEDNEDTIDTHLFYSDYENQIEGDPQPVTFHTNSEGDLFIRYDFFKGEEGDSGVEDALIDGVYHVHLKYEYTTGGWETEEMCAFIDIKTKCLVAAKITELLSDDTTDGENVHLLHYALINGSNCGCNCEDLCSLYDEIVKLTENSTLVTDCGC